MLDKAADFYLDFQRFSALKSDARNGDETAAATVARQFEGLFVQQMLSAMRAAAQIDADQHSSYLDFYHDMYDKQLAQSIAGEDRLGVARMILRQIDRVDGDSPDGHASAGRASAGRAETAAAAPVIAIGGRPAQGPPVAAGVPAGQGIAAAPIAGQPAVPAAAAAAAPADGGVRLGRVLADDFAEIARRVDRAGPARDPREFVAAAWPAARAAGERIGVSPRLLIAQAALESGWGRHTMQFADGRDSHNLFGIKAGEDWQGAVIRKPSLEFEQGVLQPRVSTFRAYASAEHSFADYADFILGRPRYAAALAVAGDDRAYIRAVHEAGYATDPQYADKVIGILDGELLRQSLAQLEPGARTHA